MILEISDIIYGKRSNELKKVFGIPGMEQKLGISDSRVHRVIVDDADPVATEQAINGLVEDVCNVIFTTSWGYMETTASCAEKYPDVYFSHGTGYLSNGKNFTNYFGRIYQARYLSGIVAGLNTKSDKIGYVAAMGTESSEVTGEIDAFALGVYSVNPDRGNTEDAGRQLKRF